MNLVASKIWSKAINLPRNIRRPNMPRKKWRRDSDRPSKRQIFKKIAETWGSWN